MWSNCEKRCEDNLESAKNVTVSVRANRHIRLRDYLTSAMIVIMP
jgi:hypothetical protein